MRESAVIIGDGRMAKIHAKVYAECGVEVEGFGVAHNWQDKIDEHSPTFVSVCSYDSAHAEQTLFALNRGCLVICEKPLGRSMPEIEALLTAERAGKREVLVNLPLSSLAFPKDGTLYDFQYLWGRGHLLRDTMHWRNSDPGYSFVHGAGVHMVDCLLRAGGPIEKVQAMGKPTSLNYPGDTIIEVIGEFASGAMFRLGINADFEGPHEHSFVVWRRNNSKWSQHRWGSDKEEPIRSFIRTKTGNLPEAMDAAAVCCAIDQAINTGATVRVGYP